MKVRVLLCGATKKHMKGKSLIGLVDINDLAQEIREYLSFKSKALGVNVSASREYDSIRVIISLEVKRPGVEVYEMLTVNETVDKLQLSMMPLRTWVESFKYKLGRQLVDFLIGE
jgi:hypothetical protein